MPRFYARLLPALLFFGAALPASAASIVVTSTTDAVVTNGNCTLREAVQAANTNTAVDACIAGTADGDQILFNITAAIQLVGGEIRITDDVSIQGGIGVLGAVGSRVTINAAGLSRIFDIDASAGAGAARRVQFSNLVLQNGNSGVGNSSAPDAGGAVDLKAGSQATFSNVDVTGSVCGINGGGIHGGTDTDIVILTSGAGTSLIQNNEARGPESNRGGGGVWGAGTVAISGNVLINGNRASGAAGSGGGVFNLAGTLTIGQGVVISNNTANRAGGGIESAGGTVTVTGATLSGNTAGTAPGNGGGLHGGGAVTVTVTGGSVTGNTAVEGGGLWISETGTLAVSGTSIRTNTATGADADQGGGGVYSDGGVATLTNATISSNQATGAAGSGGGVLNAAGGKMTISGGTVSANTSVRAGGGVETNQSGMATGNTLALQNVTVSGNTAGTAPGFGGGVHITGAAAVTVTGGSVSANTAVEGGGFWKAGAGTLTVTGTLIDDNTATGADADQGGGGVYNDGAGGTLTMTRVTVSNNDATGAAGSGGGLLNNTGATSVLTGVVFAANTAKRAGGGIEDNAGTLVTLLRTTLQSNTAGSAPGNGGGLHISGAGTVRIDSSLVVANVSTNQGGGLWNSGVGSLRVRTTTIRDNRSGTGGGVYQIAGATGLTQVEQSLIRDNVASAAGGGIAADGAGVIVANSTVSGNTAANGGGLASGGGRFLISNATIASNTATTAGGGLFRIAARGDSLLSPDNTIVADNTAPAGPDLSGVVMSRGYNLFETTAGATVVMQTGTGPNVTGVDPRLQPLASNGGATQTQAVSPGSPARGAGMTSLAVDQRGAPRTAPTTIGAFEFSGNPVAGEDAPEGAAAFALGAASPNPVRGTATLRVTTAENEAVEVVLFDVLGRRVQALYAGTPVGPVTVTLDASALAPGVYVVRMTSATAQATQRVTIAR